MNWRISRDILIDGITLKRQLLAFTQKFEFRNALQVAEKFIELSQGYHRIASKIAGLREYNVVLRIADTLEIAALLCKWANAILNADSRDQSFLQAVSARTTLLQNDLELLDRYPTTRDALAKWALDAHSLDNIGSVTNLLKTLGRIPLPVFYSVAYDSYAGLKSQLRATVAEGSPQSAVATEPVIKVLFTLDGQDWATPQAIQSGLQYDLGAKLSVSIWPKNMSILEIDYVSTIDPKTYFLTSLKLSREELLLFGSNKRFGNLVFYNSQTLQSEPVVMKVRARFSCEEDSQQTVFPTIIGHSELRARALSKESFPVFTNYPTMAIQIPKILDEVKKALPDLAPNDFNDFTKCLVYLGRYAGMVQQNGEFKGQNVNEMRDFQKHMLRNLRMTELGQEIREGEKTSGGILDLRYRNIVIELKVELEIKDRTKLREKYIAQPAQYTITSIPLSITCILDMTEKENPPSNIANNISLETPIMHGFETTSPQYPSKIAVIIIDGNIKSPSEYS
ncbi:MAG: hypothetical protein ACREOO_32720 [bacterium]